MDRALDYKHLEEELRVLTHANRLELIHLLQTPRTLDEIHLRPSPSQSAGGSPDRVISRQAVQNHLEQLEAAGLLQIAITDRKGKRGVKEYALNHARLFAILEELREISIVTTRASLDPFETVPLSRLHEAEWEEGPKLVLLRGVREGRPFPLLHVGLRPGRGWVVGRAEDAHVRLDYDPFASLENSEIVKRPDGYFVIDLRSSTNGTMLNWRRLPIGGEAKLESGDVLGIGRSLLLFRAK